MKQSYTTLGIRPKTYSYLGRCGYHISVCWVIIEHWYSHLYNPQQTNYSSYNALMIASIPMFLPTGYQILEKVEDGENIENAKST